VVHCGVGVAGHVDSQVVGDAAVNFRANVGPFIPGMTTSVQEQVDRLPWPPA
jgi:hypothetical protein